MYPNHVAERIYLYLWTYTELIVIHLHSSCNVYCKNSNTFYNSSTSLKGRVNHFKYMKLCSYFLHGWERKSAWYNIKTFTIIKHVIYQHQMLIIMYKPYLYCWSVISSKTIINVTYIIKFLCCKTFSYGNVFVNVCEETLYNHATMKQL